MNRLYFFLFVSSFAICFTVQASQPFKRSASLPDCTVFRDGSFMHDSEQSDSCIIDFDEDVDYMHQLHDEKNASDRAYDTLLQLYDKEKQAKEKFAEESRKLNLENACLLGRSRELQAENFYYVSGMYDVAKVVLPSFIITACLLIKQSQ